MIEFSQAHDRVGDCDSIGAVEGKCIIVVLDCNGTAADAAVGSPVTNLQHSVGNQRAAGVTVVPGDDQGSDAVLH